MMENPRPEEKNIIKYISNLFRLVKKTKAIKDRILRDIKNLFEYEEEENYYKPVRVSNIQSNNYIEYKSNIDRNKTLSFEEYLNKIRPHLKDHKLSQKIWHVELTVGNNFISCIDNYEKRVMHSESDNIEIMINDETNKIIKGLFDSLKNRYQNNLESMKGSAFVFDYVHLLYCKCHTLRKDIFDGRKFREFRELASNSRN